ncbi:glutathione peroxidase [Aureibacter tunicatorum]|uniref:Glutathione peroxidase n=1 Tax=Aureibacter tunicatorum TaxID=866807 RepID=A0AAE4BPH7_9BACT|nr:glutathione peroxidase [Aureibacter tunicatorum]MDR6237999.1 glutathione peroxidase [Aureibacter tunicatorum]
MNKLMLMVAALLLSSLSIVFAQNEDKTIYQFQVEDINGKTFDMSSLKGKKVMIVNTASKCGLTPQYKGLEELYEKYGKKDDFIIIGFPSNDFLSQEPGTNSEIAQFCQKNYGVTFPMMSKIKVKGDDKAPIYQFLTEKSKNGVEDSKVKWNFQKYLIGRDGRIEKVISPNVKPDDKEIIEWIESK